MWFRYEAKASLPLPIGPLFDEKKVQLARRKALQDDVRPYLSIRVSVRVYAPQHSLTVAVNERYPIRCDYTRSIAQLQ